MCYTSIKIITVAERAIVKSQGEHMSSGVQPVADFVWSVTGASQLTLKASGSSAMQ